MRLRGGLSRDVDLAWKAEIAHLAERQVMADQHLGGPFQRESLIGTRQAIESRKGDVAGQYVPLGHRTDPVRMIAGGLDDRGAVLVDALRLEQHPSCTGARFE